MSDQWFWVSTPFGTGAVIVRNGIVVGSMALFKWMRGKPWGLCARWVKNKQGEWEELPRE